MDTKEEALFMETNRCIIITGGTSQLGKSLISAFANKNWKVHATTTDLKKIDPIGIPKNVVFHELDVCNEKDIENLIMKVAETEPKIDVLINNAGFVLSGPMEGCSSEQMHRQLDVNFWGAVNAIRGILPIFKKQRGGTIINISSLCGLTTFPMLSFYHASKWALEGFSESLHYELKQFGIIVKLIEPGGIANTNEQQKIEFAESTPHEYTALINQVHHTKWFPSFTSADVVAEKISLIAMENNTTLRHQIGDDCALLLKERSEGMENEAYLTNFYSRISDQP